MSLSIRDIERSIGADMIRRPYLTASLNAIILRFFSENLALNPDEPAPLEGEKPPFLQRPAVAAVVGAMIAVITHLVVLLGFAETVAWIAIALICRTLRLPRIYAFEKLMLDCRVAVSLSSLMYIEKAVRLYIPPSSLGLPRLRVSVQGIHALGLVVTTIETVDSVGRDAAALFRLLRYHNTFSVSYFNNGVWIVVGAQKDLIEALCSDGKKYLTLPMGWHRDCVERTTYRLRVSIARERRHLRDSDVRYVGRRAVSTEVSAEMTTENLELVAHMMDQFAGACEAGENFHRFFNGKRLSIYAIGLGLALFLVVFYEGVSGLLKPSADVLTVAVGAYTLWMTVGKSAALGDTGEIVELDLEKRENFLLAFHGLAKMHKGMMNLCWVPELFRPVRSPRRDEEDCSSSSSIVSGSDWQSGSGNRHSQSVKLRRRSMGLSSSSSSVYEVEDGAVSVIEAAVCLNIFEHFGHFLKWRGDNLALDHYEVEPCGPLGHIRNVERIEGVHELSVGGEPSQVVRLGGEARPGPRAMEREEERKGR